MPRDTYRAGWAAIRYLLASIIPALVVLGGGLPLFTDRRVLARRARPASSAAELARRLSASIGIALYPDDGDDGARLLRLADAAMYRVRDRGPNGWKRYAHRSNAPSPI